MTKTIRIYPGMTDNSIELFVINNELKAIQNGKTIGFTEFSFALIQILEEAMLVDSRVEEALLKMHPGSRLRRVEQFAKCRFGGLDYEPDIQDGKIQDGEYWACPLKGKCAHEGVVCKTPFHKGQRLSNVDIQLIQQTTTDKTNEVIAEELNIPLGTLHKYKKKLYKKLGVQTKQEIAVIALLLNLI